jgi:PadR family transcriptional regulator AphA
MSTTPAPAGPDAKPPRKLTSTSYAVLGLLAVSPATTYELAKQMARGLRHIWPRAEGRIYDEPKLLARHGLARARHEHTGRRPRTVWSVTPAGRRALADWLADPGAGPVLECEALLKVSFAEHGSKADLVANLEALATHAGGMLALGRAMADDHVTNGPLHPGRLPVNGLMWNFLWQLHSALADWAAWALDEVADWPDDLHATPEASQRTMALLRSALASGPPARVIPAPPR